MWHTSTCGWFRAGDLNGAQLVPRVLGETILAIYQRETTACCSRVICQIDESRETAPIQVNRDPSLVSFATRVDGLPHHLSI